MSTLLTVLTALVFGPHPPILVPELAAGASGDLDELREACSEAVSRLVTSGAELVCVVGGAERTQWYHESASGSLAQYGVPMTVTLGSGPVNPGAALGPSHPAGTGAEPAELPLSLTIGAWLLIGCPLPRVGVGVGPDTDDEQCRVIAARAADPRPPVRLADPGTRVGLLVMGDGSACRSVRAPGYLDPRAASFDRAVARALGAGDAAGLSGLDPTLGRDLLAAGVPAWRVAGRAAAGLPITAELLYEAAPFGVGYLVASWVVGP